MDARSTPLSILRWLTTLWLGYVVVRYARVSFRAIHEAYNPGLDVEWATVWIVAVFVATLSMALIRSSIPSRIWFAIIGFGVLTILILSHALLPFLAAIAVIAVSGGLGEVILLRFRLEAVPLIERIVLAVPIGIGVLALGEFALAWFGLFTVVTNWILLLTCAVPAIIGLRRIASYPLESGLAAHLPRLVPAGFVLLLSLSWAVAPEIQYDAANVYLAVPKLYLQNGGFLDLPYFWNSYMAHLLSLIYGLCLSIGGMSAPKLFIFGTGVLAACSVYVIGRRLFSDEVGVWASMLFYSTPLVIALSGTASLDLPQTFFITSSIAAFLRWHETSRWGWMAVSGWIAGVAAASKVAALSTLIVFPVIAAFRALAQLLRRKGPAEVWKGVTVYVLLLLVVSVPWYWLVYDYTGNPFFPLLNKIFRSPYFPAENTSLDWESYGIGTSPYYLLQLPLFLTMDTSRFAAPRGGVGFTLLVALPFALAYLWKATLPYRAVVAAIVVHLTVWAFTAQYARYYIAVLPIVAVIACAIALTGQSGTLLRLNRMLLLAGVIAQAPIASVIFWNIPGRYPFDHALGRETTEQFLRRSLPASGAALFLNTVWKPGEKILGATVENTRFYFDGPVYTQHEVDLEASGLKTLPNLRDALVRDGFVYIVSITSELDRPPARFPWISSPFLNEFAEKMYSDKNAAVFRIRTR